MKDIKELSLEEKIGQLFMIGMLREDVNKHLDDLIKNDKIGGVIIYRRNYKDYPKNKDNKIPLFISIDQEGGRVNRMPSEIKNIKSATRIARTKKMEYVKESGRLIGEMLRQTGISMDYAPTLDIKRFADNHAIGDRCYGENRDDVSKYGIEVMKQIQEQKVIPVIKHFPGHGATYKDSHFRIPKIKAKKEYIEANDIKVFEKAIKEGADAIMVGHLIYKEIDKIHPASLSKTVISKYLIEQNNFQGLIITDDLKMRAVQLRYSMRVATLKAIEAGNDIVMIGLPYKRIKRVIKFITKQVKKGRISEERINHSVEKILRMKEKYEVNDDLVEGIDINTMNDAIMKLNRKIEKDEFKREVGL